MNRPPLNSLPLLSIVVLPSLYSCAFLPSEFAEEKQLNPKLEIKY